VIKSRNGARKTSKSGGEVQYFRLFVTGSSRHSVRAIDNTKRMCESYFKGRYDLEVVDLYQQPDWARDEQLVAIPTLIRYHPAPKKRFVGDMTRTSHMLRELDIRIEDFA
jgi:circadian clock protein KaiB